MCYIADIQFWAKSKEVTKGSEALMNPERVISNQGIATDALGGDAG